MIIATIKRTPRARAQIPCNTTLSKQYSTELYSSAAEEIIHQHDTSKPLFLYMAHQAVHMPMQATEYWKQNYTGSINEISRLTMAGKKRRMIGCGHGSNGWR